MIAGLKPYPAYKDSGVPWLGDVPEHWEVRRLKYVLRERDARSADGNEQLLRVSQYTGVTQRRRADGGDEPDTRAETLVGYKCAEPNDLVVNIMLAWNGSLGVSRYPGIVSPAYCVYRLGSPARPWYLHHLLRSPGYKARIKALSTGVVDSRLRLYTDDLYRLEGLLPPLPEQAAIVRFLGHADRRIRRYIRAKQRLIKLLEEQKQAIIHRAVTRGLDPDVRLKSSGVEWLGDVPEHWWVRAFTRCCIELADYRGATPTKTESGVFLVTARNIRKSWIDYETSREFVSPDEYSTIMRRGLPRCGDLLLTTEAPLGNAALVDRDDIALAQRVIRFRMNPCILVPGFVLHSVLSPYFQDQLLCRGTGSTAQGIKASKLPQLQILCPPIPEQRQILASLDDQLGPLDQVVNRAIREVTLLREYRTRLIADIVTGKLNVREAAARLPDEPEETEAADDSVAMAEGDEETEGSGLEAEEVVAETEP
jgi:type I restriction enzyme S subunit